MVYVGEQCVTIKNVVHFKTVWLIIGVTHYIHVNCGGNDNGLYIKNVINLFQNKSMRCTPSICME